MFSHRSGKTGRQRFADRKQIEDMRSPVRTELVVTTPSAKAAAVMVGRTRPLRVIGRPRSSNAVGNPYNHLLYEAVSRHGVSVEEFSGWLHALSGRFDVLHVHWPEYTVSQKSLLSSIRSGVGFLLGCWLLQRRGTRIVWTVHNLRSHENPHPRLERAFSAAFRTIVDGCFCMFRDSRAELLRNSGWRRSALRAVLTRHGDYRAAYGPTVDRARGRQLMGASLDDFVVLFFGRVRGYKNVPRLIRTFTELELPGVQLHIVGRCSEPQLAEEVDELARREPRVRVHLGFVPPSEVPHWIGAADLVVLPFAEVHNSGSALLALSYGPPVLGPAMGSMQDLVRDVGNECVRTYTGDLTPDVLARAIEWSRGRHVSPDLLAAFDWDSIAEQTVAGYRWFCGLTDALPQPGETIAADGAGARAF
jgi:beta-1,4-mannosyltransferase